MKAIDGEHSFRVSSSLDLLNHTFCEPLTNKTESKRAFLVVVCLRLCGIYQRLNLLDLF